MPSDCTTSIVLVNDPLTIRMESVTSRVEVGTDALLVKEREVRIGFKRANDQVHVNDQVLEVVLVM